MHSLVLPNQRKVADRQPLLDLRHRETVGFLVQIQGFFLPRAWAHVANVLWKCPQILRVQELQSKYLPKQKGMSHV